MKFVSNIFKKSIIKDDYGFLRNMLLVEKYRCEIERLKIVTIGFEKNIDILLLWDYKSLLLKRIWNQDDK
ncbi:hypothetical protein C3F34_12150 [Acinetobacter sp. ACNIH2]|nr:hypothetical protein C3F34_12150 [Acinetobacter sp. ACNIH2]